MHKFFFFFLMDLLVVEYTIIGIMIRPLQEARLGSPLTRFGC
jgi:hypothetical protein